MRISVVPSAAFLKRIGRCPAEEYWTVFVFLSIKRQIVVRNIPKGLFTERR